MEKEDVRRFFNELSQGWSQPTRVLLLGGAAALLLGGRRPTMDVDFEVQIPPDQGLWDAFEEAIQEVRKKTGIAAQYAESIERWSQLTFLDYRKTSRSFGLFGKI